ncbi:hypothetical protein K7X08_011239 [Anisodus acutangulus]|uniref:Protein kinase domain-containing protein n=1 Tax=Anisodus acutangulus TaxID=402998 RepID=A0A9Q1R8J5_9SOLA|nr:hypothetical protein K7X08_011239 [Anisodus acutangulus]
MLTDENIRLSYLHSEKIAHRDVKTDNLTLDKKERVTLIDFGLSSEFFSLGLDYPPMMVGTAGTIGYMAPEVLSDPAYDHKCDVFSFGICLWEIIEGLIPKSCPTALSDIMKKRGDVKPQNRPEMKEVVHMLEVIQTTKGRHQHEPLSCFRFA